MITVTASVEDVWVKAGGGDVNELNIFSYFHSDAGTHMYIDDRYLAIYSDEDMDDLITALQYAQMKRRENQQ